jgi:hypothetical protein
MANGMCAGLAPATAASNRARLTVLGSGTRTVTRSCGSALPGNGPSGRADHDDPPLSVISGVTPIASRTAVARPVAVPRLRCMVTALAMASRRISTGSSPSSSAPIHWPSQSRKSSGASQGEK